MQPPVTGDDWVGIGADPLPAEAALAWATRPGCGAVVAFVGTVRDHAAGRPGVSELEYEAYAEEVAVRLGRIAGEARRRWPETGRTVLLHRIGRLAVEERSVVVVVSAPHRAEAFAAAHWAIDTLKSSVPIWKRETWTGGQAWGGGAQEIVEVGP
ncbi:MAG: molybdenum cofactor biosynthesis protein MoaE [Acidimicrobiales bacterium]